MSGPTSTAEVVVVGLGAMGAATLYQLALRGARPMGLDRFNPPHDQGSSHGETRITRQAVGEGDQYAPLVIRSHEIWRELEAATGEQLLEACGGVIIGPSTRASSHHAKPDFVKTTVAVAERFNIAHEVLDRGELSRRFPQFIGLAEDDMAYYEPGAGYVFPERCVAAQLAEAQRLGATIATGRTVTAITQTGASVRIVTTDGTIETPYAIVAAGPWAGRLLGPPFDQLLRVTRQTLHWFAPEDPSVFESSRCPVFIRMHGAGDSDYFYGFPVAAGSTGVKVATEQYEATADPDTVDRDVSAHEAAELHRVHLAGRLAGVTPRAIRSLACLYTNTADANFLIDTHPAMDRVTVISACSGHGFKHSAAIGEAVAGRVLTNRSAWDLSAFSLRRFA